MSNTAQEKLTELESNLNRIQEHIREGLAAGNFGDRAGEIKKHAEAAKKAFDWLDNFTVMSPATPEKESATPQVLGSGFYRDATPGTFGRSEFLDLLVACQDGRCTCMRALEIIEREMAAKRQPKTQGGPTAKEWLDWFGVSNMNDLAASDKFKSMIDHPDFGTAQSWTFCDGYLLVTGDTAWWAWASPGGPCMVVGTMFPITQTPTTWGAGEAQSEAMKQAAESSGVPVLIQQAPAKTVCCKFCHKDTPAATAHYHDGGWVGDDCCWDERLRATE